ncbi:hypothetical protein EJ04DRAFT_231139 [Polyplosphaeria fusca]|uniref:Uncharacterized protein n=1 Tax=Polyplosphaeria fusca TaxID=682080 RepID=A0A9P4V3T7_9PLEO|nr:hypothetical protein EJ04DRAFT_231139 [Polyplosphaeria fusca]
MKQGPWTQVLTCTFTPPRGTDMHNIKDFSVHRRLLRILVVWVFGSRLSEGALAETTGIGWGLDDLDSQLRVGLDKLGVRLL